MTNSRKTEWAKEKWKTFKTTRHNLGLSGIKHPWVDGRTRENTHAEDSWLKESTDRCGQKLYGRGKIERVTNLRSETGTSRAAGTSPKKRNKDWKKKNGHSLTVGRTSIRTYRKTKRREEKEGAVTAGGKRFGKEKTNQEQELEGNRGTTRKQQTQMNRKNGGRRRKRKKKGENWGHRKKTPNNQKTPKHTRGAKKSKATEQGIKKDWDPFEKRRENTGIAPTCQTNGTSKLLE